MTRDSEEIKTIEQWRWSELQGLELLVSDNAEELQHNHPSSIKARDHIKSNATAVSTAAVSTPQVKPGTQDSVGTSGTVVEMEVSAPENNKDGGGVPEKTGAPPPAVGFGELFRFADGLDYFLMSFGTVGAIVHGSSLPLFLRFFADLVNSFGSNANDVDKMTQEVLKYAFYFLVVGAAIWGFSKNI